MEDLTPPGFTPYAPFLYEDKDVTVCVRPEDVKGCQTYRDMNDGDVWTVVITMRDNPIRVKLPQESARKLVHGVAHAIQEETRRSVRNSMLFRKRD